MSSMFSKAERANILFRIERHLNCLDHCCEMARRDQSKASRIFGVSSDLQREAMVAASIDVELYCSIVEVFEQGFACGLGPQAKQLDRLLELIDQARDQLNSA